MVASRLAPEVASIARFKLAFIITAIKVAQVASMALAFVALALVELGLVQGSIDNSSSYLLITYL